MAVRSGNFHLGLMLVLALSVSMWPAVSRAYTADEQQACSGDAMRLCSAFIPDVDRITVCMIQNKTQLSPGCRAFFREPEAEATPVNTGRPMNINPENSKKPLSARLRKHRKSTKSESAKSDSTKSDED